MRPLMRHGIVASVLLALIAFAACVDSEFDDGKFACRVGSGNSECPPGQHCAADGRCRSAEPSGVDASREDAAPDDAGDAGPPPPCSPAPELVWKVETKDRAPAALALSEDGHLYAVGAADKKAWVAEIDRCDGHTIREHILEAASLPEESATLTGLSIGADIFVIGRKGGDADGGKGGAPIVARVDRELTTATLEDLGVSGLGTVQASYTARLDNEVWIAGSKESAGLVQGFARHTGGGGQPCEATTTQPASGIAIRTGTALDVLQRKGTTGIVVQELGPSCLDIPAFKDLTLPLTNVIPIDLVATPSAGIVAFGTAGNGQPNKVVWLSRAAAGADWVTTTLDSVLDNVEEARKLATDGMSLFALSAQQNQGKISPLVARFPLAFGATAQPEVMKQPFNQTIDDARGLAVETTGDGVYSAGVVGKSGLIARCTKALQCPL